MVFCNQNDTYVVAYGRSHNPYFNRWFSAIKRNILKLMGEIGHNPYFNRWFSAILIGDEKCCLLKVTILILIDGFLQFINKYVPLIGTEVTILILIDGFLQYF